MLVFVAAEYYLLKMSLKIGPSICIYHEYLFSFILFFFFAAEHFEAIILHYKYYFITLYLYLSTVVFFNLDNVNDLFDQTTRNWK